MKILRMEYVDVAFQQTPPHRPLMSQKNPPLSDGRNLGMAPKL